MVKLSNIAIVGMTGRFPGADNIETLWRNLLNDGDSFTDFQQQDFETLGFSLKDTPDINFVTRCPRLKDALGFDLELLGGDLQSALELPPQARLLVQCCRELMNTTGYSRKSFDGIIGFWGGQAFDNYALRCLQAQHGLLPTLPNPNQSNELSCLGPSLSQYLDLNGPVVNLQTACSTSLVAVNQASTSLATYQCDIALAGGVSIQYAYLPGYEYKAGEIFSPDGYCRSFDSRAQGTVLGEGCAVLMLRRLEDALRDGDTIHGVILGSAVNNDGSDRAGFTAPSISGQIDLLQKAYTNAGISPADVSYIETHGTGTPIGDPLEVSALRQFFGSNSAKTKHCALGALKASIGHLDAAAGAAGLIKTLCALKNQTIPKVHNFEHANPALNLSSSSFYIPDKNLPWSKNTSPRIAGVSSFGMGGTNAHVIVSEHVEM